MGSSMSYQIKMIADDHDKRGESKMEAKMEAKENNLPQTEWTREGIYSTSTYNDFIRVNSQMTNQIKAEFHVTKIAQIKPEMFTRFWEQNAPNWTLTTQKTYLDHFSRLSDYLKEKGWGKGFINSENKPQIEKGWKSIGNRTDRALPWTEKEIEQLKSELPDKYQNVITVFTETGVRAIEMQRIRGYHVDFEKGILHVEQGKGGRSRDVPLSENAMNAIKSEMEKYGLNKMEKVFQNIKTNNLRQAIRRFNQKHDLQNKSIHSFRHYYARNEYKKSFDALPQWTHRRSAVARGKVSHLLGHGKQGQDFGRISVTYSYVSGDDAKDLEKE